MKLYNVYYIEQDQSNLFGHRRYQVTTDDFNKWLKKHNAQRIEERNEPEKADDFQVDLTSLSIYSKENTDD